MVKIEIENPKDTYTEIAELIRAHFRKVPARYKSENGFAFTYPNVYRIYLRIATEGLHK